ncbi:MAG: cytochrome c [bacterium]
MKTATLFVALTTSMLMFLAVQKSDQKIVKTSTLRMSQIAGHELFVLKKCNECHTLANKAEGELTPLGSKGEDDWFKQHVSEESEIVLGEAKSKRKKRRILKREITALTDFLFDAKAAEKKQVLALPENIRQGAYLGYQNNCLGCHKIAGTGKEVGPDLTYVADKKSGREWFIKNLENPQQFSPESPMPAFEGKLSEEVIGLIADYVLTLRK